MKSRSAAIGVFGAALTALTSSWASAQGASCADPTYVAPDGGPVPFFLSNTSGSTAHVFFSVATRNGNSYAITLRTPYDSNTNLSQQPSFQLWTDPGICATAPTTTPTATTASDPALGAGGGKRQSFTAATSGPMIVDVALPATYSATVYLEVADTTMYSPTFSRSNTTPVILTFWSFQNTTGSPITGTLTLFTITGGSVTNGTTTVVINANSTLATNTQAMNIPLGQTGTAKFTHDGPPGGILVQAVTTNQTSYVQVVPFQAVRQVR